MAKLDNQQFQTDASLTAIAIAYRNPDVVMIADEVLPRVPVGGRSFKWTEYPEAEMFSVPDTRVGNRSAPNQVELQGEQKDSGVVDFGIDIPLDNPTIAEAERAGYNPRNRATELATNIVLLDREIRVAATVTDASAYHADQKLGATAAAFFDAAADPFESIDAMLDACWMKPNQLVFGHAAWRAFRKHPKAVQAVKGTTTASGRLTRQEVAEAFEVGRILVGSGRVNVARPGLAPTMQRTWGNTISGQFIDRSATTETGGLTFGLTAVHGTRVAGTKTVDMGLHGGQIVRSGESVRELIVARRAGFLISLS
ncbi:Phage major capsid protein E [Bosea sp. CRIB-10]|uniref:major capsid protein n=1 Tax=Bosea sp. CRIB-10 TaxID=378404 RepID=UPI0008EC8D2C|nr:major capsid protein [Bosea sp. CRIB-10]SFD76925.1 Phage major capsid protein E [Bosea sp. CRIB-10]